MGTKLISVRCPSDILEKLDAITQQTNRNRNTVIVGAIRLFCQHVRHQNNHIIPPYLKEIEVKNTHFIFRQGRDESSEGNTSNQ